MKTAIVALTRKGAELAFKIGYVLNADIYVREYVKENGDALISGKEIMFMDAGKAHDASFADSDNACGSSGTGCEISYYEGKSSFFNKQVERL